MLIGEVRTKVLMCVLTLGYSSRRVVRVFRHRRQQHWLQALVGLRCLAASAGRQP